MAFTFEQLLAADPANPANIAQNAAITIFAPGDVTMTPLSITDPDGTPLPNPFPVNANGFGPAFAHDTLDRVAWSGGGFTGFVTSYEGMKQVAVDAQAAAENAAANAGAEAAAVAAAAIGDATADATAAAASAATAATNAASSATAAANAAALVGAPADTAIAAAVNNGASATKAALSATYGKVSFVDVEDFRNVGGTDVSDDQCIQRAITYAGANSIPVVKLTRKLYLPRKQINMSGIYNLVVEGLGAGVTIVKFTGTLADNNVALGGGFTVSGSGGGCGNILFRNFTVQGTIVDDTNGIPRRTRTKSGGGGVNQAFRFIGDLQPLPGGGVDTSLYPVRDIRIEDVRVENVNQPWLLSGIRGDASVVRTTSYNTMDPSWIYNERAIGHHLITINGHDNGFSFSRGNQSVTASNLSAYNCAGYAQWFGGFLVEANANDYGPQNLNVTNISGQNCGWGGLYLDEAPRNGRISGVYMRGMLRGTASADFGDASAGTGIRIGGSPSNDLANQTAVATNLEISNFMLIDCAKGGIIVSGAQDVTVSDGTIINPGSATDYTGAVVPSTSTSENFGIAAKPGSTSKITRFTATNVRVVDTRGTPLANYAIFMTGATDTVWTNVRGVNTRQAVSTDSSVYREYQGGVNFNSIIRPTQGAVAGTNGSTGTVPGFSTNGATGSRKTLVQALTAGLLRWDMASNATAESGSNAGSDLELVSKTDAGATLHTIWQVVRNVGTHVWKRAYVDSRVSQTLAADGAVTIDAAAGNIQSVTLSANATSSTITNPSTGQRLTLIWWQDATGGRTYVWPTGVKFASGTAPGASTAAFFRDSITFMYDGSAWVEIGRALAVR